MSVYKAINAVQAELAKEGIGKDRKNEQQGFKFRGIDDVYNAVSPLLAKNGLCILPRCLERELTERTNAKGTALFYVVVKMEFDFIAVDDGAAGKHTVGPMYGEAMDSGDKATNKAMSAAYKYALMQAFSIPTEGDNDADATTHEVKHVDRTKVMKVRTKIQEHVAADRELGVLEEWHFAQSQGEDFCSGVWAGLTTPERNYVRAANNNEKERLAAEKAAA